MISVGYYCSENNGESKTKILQHIHFRHSQAVMQAYPILKCEEAAMGSRIPPQHPDKSFYNVLSFYSKVSAKTSQLSWFVKSVTNIPLAAGAPGVSVNSIVAIQEEGRQLVGMWFARVLEVHPSYILVQYFEKIKPRQPQLYFLSNGQYYVEKSLIICSGVSMQPSLTGAGISRGDSELTLQWRLQYPVKYFLGLANQGLSIKPI